MTIRLTVSLPDDLWRGLRRLAEDNRSADGRASVSGIVSDLIRQRLSSEARMESRQVEARAGRAGANA